MLFRTDGQILLKDNGIGDGDVFTFGCFDVNKEESDVIDFSFNDEIFFQYLDVIT